MEKIVFQTETGEAVEFYVLEQTRIGGMDYILVTDQQEDEEETEAEALILRDMSQPGEEEALYEIVTDDEELNAVAAVFENMLDDIDLS